MPAQLCVSAFLRASKMCARGGCVPQCVVKGERIKNKMATRALNVLPIQRARRSHSITTGG